MNPMKSKIIIATLIASIAVCSTSWAQKPAKEGPKEALKFAKKTCGRYDKWLQTYPNCNPVEFTGMNHIIPMGKDLWTRQQILDDFNQNKTPEQVAPIVILKTEFCYQDGAMCTATTAAFEKQSTPFLHHFRVYGYWVYQDSDWTQNAKGEWDRKYVDIKDTEFNDLITKEYEFDQGPGANIFFLNPKGGEDLLRTDAGELDLSMEALKEYKGETPLLTLVLIALLAELNLSESN
jgi:hypothetical protein